MFFALSIFGSSFQCEVFWINRLFWPEFRIGTFNWGFVSFSKMTFFSTVKNKFRYFRLIFGFLPITSLSRMKLIPTEISAIFFEKQNEKYQKFSVQNCSFLLFATLADLVLVDDLSFRLRLPPKIVQVTGVTKIVKDSISSGAFWGVLIGSDVVFQALN